MPFHPVGHRGPPLQPPFRRQYARDPGIDRHRLVQGLGQRLENGLHDVVRVPPIRHVDVQVHGRVRRQRLKEVLEEVQVEALDPPVRQLDVVDEIGPAAEVHRDLRQRLVQRHPGRPEAPDPRLRAQRLLERLAEDDADVLHRVVVVDVRVAAGLDRQVEEAVLGQQIQHVIKERDRRADLPLAGPVQGQPDLDPAFGGVPLDRRPPRGLHRMRASTDCACAPSPSMCARRTMWSLALAKSSLVYDTMLDFLTYASRERAERKSNIVSYTKEDLDFLSALSLEAYVRKSNIVSYTKEDLDFLTYASRERAEWKRAAPPVGR